MVIVLICLFFAKEAPMARKIEWSLNDGKCKMDRINSAVICVISRKNFQLGVPVDLRR